MKKIIYADGSTQETRITDHFTLTGLTEKYISKIKKIENIILKLNKCYENEEINMKNFLNDVAYWTIELKDNYNKLLFNCGVNYNNFFKNVIDVIEA